MTRTILTVVHDDAEQDGYEPYSLEFLREAIEQADGEITEEVEE